HATTLTVWGGVRTASYLLPLKKGQPPVEARIEFKPAGGSSGGGKALSTGSSGAAVGASGSGSGTPGPKGTKGASRDGAYTVLQTVKITSKSGYFRIKRAFTKSGTVRIGWTEPNGKKVYSRTQQIAIG